MFKGHVSRSGAVLGTLAVGGAVTVATSWALGRLLQGKRATEPSRRIYEYCRQRRSPELSRRLEQVVTTLGDYSVIAPFTVLVGGGLTYQRRDWRPLSLLTVGLAAEICLQKTIQQLVRGSAPPQETSIGPPGYFPSGGAARTVITFGLLAHLLTQDRDSPAERRALWSIVAAMAAAQGGSRLYLGRHWPEDVAGGWLFGWLILRTLTRADRLIATGPGQPESDLPPRAADSAQVGVEVQAERVADGIEQHPDVVLRLEAGHRGAELDRVGHGRGQVVHRDIEVHHHLLASRFRWPGRRHVVRGGLEG
jgi:hypothetical protein